MTNSNKPLGMLNVQADGSIQFSPLNNNLRLVLTQEWIPVQYPDGANSTNCQTSHRPLPGTGCWSKDFQLAGIFQCWGSAYEEFESGPGNFTVAIVERLDGTVHELVPSCIKFVNANNLNDQEKEFLAQQFKQFEADGPGQK